MQVSYNLLKEYVDIDLSAKSLAERLSLNGIVAERIKPIFEGIEGVLVGKIVDIKTHENNRNLSICTVDIEDRQLEIICGAKNIKVDDHVPVVVEGGYLPGFGKIDGKKIQGFYSQGMICSAWELGLEKSKSSGVLILEKDCPLGESIKNLNGILGDVIFDFEIFSNRPDLLSIIGIAREIAAFSGKTLRIPKIDLLETEEIASDFVSVKVVDEELCPRYAGRIIKGLKVKESPFWLSWKLFLLGIRPINNVVDVTNFVMMETGQPLHAFDLRYIRDRKIIVRRARSGEKFNTLDGVERILKDDNLVIADSERAIALAGVMGGENSEIKPDTKDVFLESAYFDPVSTRRTSSYFGLRTDASNRFEKGIDAYGQVFALNRSAHLITKLTPGQVLSGTIDQSSKKLPISRSIKLNLPKINKVLGTKIENNGNDSKSRIVEILTRLGFKIDYDNDQFLGLTPPSFRNDIKIDMDVIEEIARIYGYEKIPSRLFNSTVVQEGKDARQKSIDRIRETLIGCGMHQIINFSMITPKWFDWLKLPPSHRLCHAVKLANPLIQEQTIMRTTLIPGLLKTIQWNVNHSLEKIKLFEIGRTYFPQPGELNIPLPIEKLMIAGGIAKIGRGDLWEKTENWDLFYLKGILESLFDRLGIDSIDYEAGDLPFYSPEKSGLIKSKGKNIAVFGEINQDVADFLDVPGNILLFELDFSELYPLIKDGPSFQPLPKYPHIQRDLAIVVDERVNFEQIKREVLKVNPEIGKRIELFDVFRGKQIKHGFKSIAFSIFFLADDRTLTDVEVDKIMEDVKIRLNKLFKADLRQ